MLRDKIKQEMEEAFPGIEEGKPIHHPGRQGYVIVWRGTKVLVRKRASYDKIPFPVGGGEVSP